MKTANLEFRLQDRRSHLAALCGIPLSGRGPAKTLGLVVVNTAEGRFEADAWTTTASRRVGNAIEIRQTAATGALELRSTWTDDGSGVVRRRDVLTNTGSAPRAIHRCLARIALPAGAYDLYVQQSRWCNENQGAWLPLHAGELTLRSAWGRTTQGSTPYACIRNRQTREGLAFHVVPTGNWMIRISAITQMDRPTIPVVELGLSDENLRLPLQPGESLALPELLFQALPQGEPHLAAPILHASLLNRPGTLSRRRPPVIYNTWFDQFEVLDVPRLRRQLAAVRAAGCEVFVVDAGWYGAGSSPWWSQAGDWREKTKTAFRGRMRAFADEVRKAGLGFGLWMEPERIGPDASLRTEHPDWLVPVDASSRLDLANPAAYAWLRGEMGRLIETYGVTWMKIDFNFDLDADPAGRELDGYVACRKRLLDEIRAAYPKTFFENCASGGMRLDLAAMAQFDSHFLSDTAEPIDTLRISQGAFLRVPPGRIGRWAILRSAVNVIPRYGLRQEASPAALLAPGGALWEPAETVGLDFALLAAMPGVLGLSGDPASLPTEAAARLREHIAFYKRHRAFIAGSVAHLLTPPEPIGNRSGWVVFQLQNPADTASLLFVYRLGVCPDLPTWRLRNLRPSARYTVRRALDAQAKTAVMTGQALMEDGLAVDLSSPWGSRICAAAVFVIQPKGR